MQEMYEWTVLGHETLLETTSVTITVLTVILLPCREIIMFTGKNYHKIQEVSLSALTFFPLEIKHILQ